MNGYDYSQAGMYYITLCVQNRVCLFGKIVDDQMILNDAGKMVERWYFELENKCPITDNHDHFISDKWLHPITDNDSKYGIHNKKYNATIGDAFDWFKTMTTNEYIRRVKTLG
jgi:hypothetical protein